MTKEALMVYKTQVKLSGVDTVDGLAILGGIVASIERDGTPVRCAADDPTSGYLTVRLELDPTTHAITHEDGGTLASVRSGRCLLDAIDRAIAATSVPANARGAVRFYSVEMPP